MQYYVEKTDNKINPICFHVPCEAKKPYSDPERNHDNYNFYIDTNKALRYEL